MAIDWRRYIDIRELEWRLRDCMGKYKLDTFYTICRRSTVSSVSIKQDFEQAVRGCFFDLARGGAIAIELDVKRRALFVRRPALKKAYNVTLLAWWINSWSSLDVWVVGQKLRMEAELDESRQR